MSSSEVSSIPQANNYQTLTTSCPIYKPRVIYANQGTAPVVSLTSETEVRFELPSNVCYNKSISDLEYTVNFGIEANKGVALLQRQSNISRVSLTTEKGVVVAEAQNVIPFQRNVLSINTPMEDFLTLPGSNSYIGGVQYNPNSQHIGFGPIRTLATASATGYVQSATGTTDLIAPSQNSSPDLSWGIDTGGYGTSYSIPLKFLLPNSVLAENVDFLSAERLFLSVYFCAFQDVSRVSSGTGPAGQLVTFSSGTTPATAPTISGLQLVLKQQMNQSIVDLVRSKVMNGGLEYMIPQIVEVKDTIASTFYSNNMKLIPRSQNQKLMRFYFNVVNHSSSGVPKYYHGGDSVNNISNIRMAINGEYQSDGVLTPVQYWVQNKDKFLRCALTLNDFLSHNACFVYDFTGQNKFNLLQQNLNLDAGLELGPGTDLTVEINKPNANSRTYYAWAILTRHLRSDAGGVSVY
jgi:hypothetical protein